MADFIHKEYRKNKWHLRKEYGKLNMLEYVEFLRITCYGLRRIGQKAADR